MSNTLTLAPAETVEAPPVAHVLIRGVTMGGRRWRSARCTCKQWAMSSSDDLDGFEMVRREFLTHRNFHEKTAN